MGHHPASTNTMIPEVSAHLTPSTEGASDSSAGNVFAKMLPALESDAPSVEGVRCAETSGIIVFVSRG